jgi:hypothetical protein
MRLSSDKNNYLMTNKEGATYMSKYGEYLKFDPTTKFVDASEGSHSQNSNEMVFDNFFQNNTALFFENQELIMSVAELYSFRPKVLNSGMAYCGGFICPLGALFESYKKGVHFYLKSFKGYEDLWLISMNGSPLNGMHTTIWWCAEMKKIVSFDSSTLNLNRTFNLKYFGCAYSEYHKAVRHDEFPRVFNQMGFVYQWLL